jgi:hypothetical protein
MRLPSIKGWASSNGGILASPVSYSSLKQHGVYPFSESVASKPHAPASATSGSPPITALSIEFVAKPQEAHRVQAAIPAAIAGALKDVTGFAGCLVMISDQEARLVTVITLWTGNERVKCCRENVRWVNALLAPYLDRRIRVQTMVVHLPMIRPETNDTSECFAMRNLSSEDETACVA